MKPQMVWASHYAGQAPKFNQGKMFVNKKTFFN